MEYDAGKTKVRRPKLGKKTIEKLSSTGPFVRILPICRKWSYDQVVGFPCRVISTKSRLVNVLNKTMKLSDRHYFV